MSTSPPARLTIPDADQRMIEACLLRKDPPDRPLLEAFWRMGYAHGVMVAVKPLAQTEKQK